MTCLLWNGIVKNEGKILRRCVNSLLPHIQGAVIVDTGSTDDTVELLGHLFAAAGKRLELHYVPFENFEQARNEALRLARVSPLYWDYLLLVDADMELKVTRPGWSEGLTGLSYDAKQTAGAVSYFNRRLVSRQATGEFRGVTHEYLDIETAGAIDGIEFIDHADGSNRPEKYQRDIELLGKALETETRPGLIERYHYYLAQSYFDAGQWLKAAEHYRIRVSLGGFEEERWNAQLHLAHCLDNLGDRSGFLWEAMQAYDMRPHRGETLYDLAKYFRLRGANHISLLFSEPGMGLPYPGQDLLFVNNHVHHTGLKEEFSICAYYDKSRRARGAKVCNALALQGNHLARSNLYWYLKPLAEWVPSFHPTQLRFPEPDEGYKFTNPSVTSVDGKPIVLLRAVNYTITPEGRYDTGSDDLTICTRNFLFDPSNITMSEMLTELALPDGLPDPKYRLVRGFEDSRLFVWQDKLWTISVVREQNPDGWCEQVLCPLEAAKYGSDWRRILPSQRAHEKNWAPFVVEGALRFVYRPGVLVDVDGHLVRQPDCGFAVDNISGGSQVVDVLGVYLALVHEAGTIPGRPFNRYYRHRFIRYSRAGEVRGISPPFVFFDRQIEFAAGMAYFPDKGQLMVSFGVRDAEAWLATMDAYQVINFIEAYG